MNSTAYDGHRNLLSRSSVILVASVSAGSLSVLMSLIIARYVGASEFGVYTITLSLQNVIALLAGFGIATAVSKYIAEYQRDDLSQALRFAKTALMLAPLFSLVAVSFYILLRERIGEGLYGDSRVTDLIPFSAVVVMTGAVLSAASGIVQGCQRIRVLALMQVANAAISLVLVIAFLPALGIRGAFLASATSQSLVAVSALIRLNTGSFPITKVQLGVRNVEIARRLIWFAFPALLSSLLVLLVYWTGNTLLILEAGFEAMGYFAVAMVGYQALSYVTYSIVIPLIPRVSELNSCARRDIQPLVSRLVLLVSLFFFPILFLIALFSDVIVRILYGLAYSDAATVFYLMMVACYFSSLTTILSAIIIGLGRIWLGLSLNCLWAIAFIALALFGIRFWTTEGLGLAFCLSYICLLALSFVVSRNVLGINFKESYPATSLAGLFFATGFAVLIGNLGSIAFVKLGLLALALMCMMWLGRSSVLGLLRRQWQPKAY